MVIPERVYERATHWADRDETTGCLVSRYSVGSHGYAQIGWNEDGERTVTLVHRVVWQRNHGPIPDGWTVDHEECRNPKCCEITHLRLITNLDNARRNKAGRDWAIGTGECIRGHSASHWKPKGEITRSGRPRVKGYCSECNKENQMNYLNRKSF